MRHTLIGKVFSEEIGRDADPSIIEKMSRNCAHTFIPLFGQRFHIPLFFMVTNAAKNTVVIFIVKNNRRSSHGARKFRLKFYENIKSAIGVDPI